MRIAGTTSNPFPTRKYTDEELRLMDFIIDLGYGLTSVDINNYAITSQSRVIFNDEEISFNGHVFGTPAC